MIKINYDELHELELELLEKVITTCEKHNIQYYLSAGTLLGAIRDKAIIPWDTDIDIEVPITDYEKFHEYVSKENPDIVVYYRQESHTSNLLKIGFKNIPYDIIHIDVYPLIGSSNSPEKGIKVINKINRAAMIKRIKRVKKERVNNFFLYMIIKIIRLPLLLISMGRLKKTIEKQLYYYDYDTSDYLLRPFSKYKENTIFPKETYNKFEYITFYHLKVRIPSNYDEILTKQYSDYMLPPKKFVDGFDKKQNVTEIPKWLYDKYLVDTIEG